MILHGSWIINEQKQYEFMFWGEDGKTIFKRRGRSTIDALPIYDKLVKINELEDILEANYKENSTGIYKLENNESGEIVFIENEIIGVVFESYKTLSILLALENKLISCDNIKLSDELTYWIRVAQLGAEFITKHKYYPSLIKNKNEIVSRWSVYTTNAQDIRRINILRKNMPPSCKSYFILKKSKADFRYKDSKNLLYSFLNWIIDGFVRESNKMYNSDKKNLEQLNENQLTLNWSTSIYTSQGVVNADFEEKKQLIESYNKWIQPLRQVKTNVSFRTCFKISAPENDKELWLVEYVLQSMDDLSLILPAAMVWKENREEFTFLNKKFENPQERLLEDLANAARIYPNIEKSLYYASPIGFKLSIEELYSFFKQEAYILEEAGFGIIAPSWWKRQAQFSVSIKSKDSKNVSKIVTESKFSLDTVLDYDWKLSLGDDELSLDEFKKLSKLKVPLVQIRGQWVQINPDQIKSFQKFLKKSQEKVKLAEVLRLQLSNAEVLPGIVVKEIKNNAVINDFIEHLHDFNKLKEIKSPINFQGILRKYQEIGVSWLVFLREHGMGACLADDMGLGKTIQTICLLLYERENKLTDKPTLLICPTSVVGNWKKEIERFAPSLNVMIHHGNKRLSGKEFENEAENHHLIITTYALTVKDEVSFNNVDWSGIVIDEAQNIKNTSSKQTQAIKRLKSTYKIALTGTPVENRLSDLWSIFDFINPGYLFNWAEFRNRYAVPIEREHNNKRSEQLKRIISPFVLRRLKSDPNIIEDLPEKIETKEYSNLTKEQATLYQAIVNDMVKKIEESKGIERKGMVLATLTKLKQICNHPAQFLKDNTSIKGRSGKLERLIELLEEITLEGDRALVFTQFAEMGDILKCEIEKRLGVKTLFLYGGTSRKNREEMINSFQEDGKEPMIFILSLKAGGVGLNLTKANHVFHFDRWWNPAVENQATDRAYRIGQKKNVQVHKFVCVGTLEEKIDKMIEEKQMLADSIVGSSENWISEMSNEELRDLFNLSDIE